MNRWRSYILVGYLAATMALPASVWHVHHDDEDHHGGQDESCSYCFVVKTISVAVDSTPPTWIVAEVSWTHVDESNEVAGNISILCTPPRAPPHTS